MSDHDGGSARQANQGGTVVEHVNHNRGRAGEASPADDVMDGEHGGWGDGMKLGGGGTGAEHVNHDGGSAAQANPVDDVMDGEHGGWGDGMEEEGAAWGVGMEEPNADSVVKKVGVGDSGEEEVEMITETCEDGEYLF